MNRSVWFGAGVAAGVYAMVRARRLAEAFTVDGMRDRVGAAVHGARVLVEEIDQGRADAELHLRERYRLAIADQQGPPELTGRSDPAESLPAPEKGTHR